MKFLGIGMTNALKDPQRWVVETVNNSYLASNIMAISPAANGVAAEVPECLEVH